MPSYDNFLKYMEKHPKALESMGRKEKLLKFKETYGVERRTKLCCPVCTHHFERGTLYQGIEYPNQFTCNKCELTFIIELPGGNEDFLNKLDEAHKKKAEEEKEEGKELKEEES